MREKVEGYALSVKGFLGKLSEKIAFDNEENGTGRNLLKWSIETRLFFNEMEIVHPNTERTILLCIQCFFANMATERKYQRKVWKIF